MKVLLLTDSLAYSGPARQLCLLADGLSSGSVEVTVCVLGTQTPWAKALAARGVLVHTLNRTRLFQPKCFLGLMKLVRSISPDFIHCWGHMALRWAALAGRGGRLIADHVIGSPEPGWADRWLLRQATRVVVGVPAQQVWLVESSVSRDKMESIAPGVSPDPVAPAAMPGSSDRLPAGARVLLGIGPLEPDKGFQDAVWAFDILKFLYDDLHLVLVGEGSDTARVSSFIHTIGAPDRVHLTGSLPDTAVRGWLARAEVVWVPSRKDRGWNAALEAMAAGRPVVAARHTGLADIVRDGETGQLFPPGDKAELARQTRLLLEAPERRRQLGEAGRARVREHFSAVRLAADYQRLYEDREITQTGPKNASPVPAGGAQ